MNAGPDVERLIADWLHEEAPVRAPDRILEEAGRTIDRTHQRRFVAGWRESMFSIRGLAAAAVIGVLVVGGAAMVASQLGPPDSGVGATMTPGPSPTVGPSPGFVGAGPLAPGPYRVTTIDGVEFTFDVPAGWAGPTATGFAILKNGAGDQAAVILSFWQPANVYADPCNSGSLLSPGVGPTVDDLVTALAAQPFTETTTSTPVTVDGFSGQRFDYNVTPGEAGCIGQFGQLWLWRDADGGDRTEDHDQLNELMVLDVAGSRAVINLSYLPDTSEADRIELQAIFETIRIDP